MSFAHLHVHTMSACSTARAASIGCSTPAKPRAWSTCDHRPRRALRRGGFLQAGQGAGAAPHPGLRGLCGPGSRFSKTSQDKEDAHLVLLAEKRDWLPQPD